jgi:hypothetical protein
MARINKDAAIKQQTGLPALEDFLTSEANNDTVPAIVTAADGMKPPEPAKLTEGEFVFSVPAIIALGKGDYQSGLDLITQMHEELRGLASGDYGYE